MKPKKPKYFLSVLPSTSYPCFLYCHTKNTLKSNLPSAPIAKTVLKAKSTFKLLIVFE